MFDYFKGFVTEKRKTSKSCFVTLETSGAGYLLEVTELDYSLIEINEDKPIKIYCVLQHREDSMSLYGFIKKEARDIFQVLMTVSGVGAKMALALLNEFDTCSLISLVIEGDYKELTRAKGVGPKLAQKIILELKDKLIKVNIPLQLSEERLQKTEAIGDTQAVLLSLGYEEKEIEEAISKIIPTVSDKSNPEEILRKVLTTLSI